VQNVKGQMATEKNIFVSGTKIGKGKGKVGPVRN
jgi:hypothetical protein